MPYIEHYVGEQLLLGGKVEMQTRNGKWVPARRLGYNSIPHTIKSLWLVATGKADIVIWENEENSRIND